MRDFPAFSAAVHARFEQMSGGEMFVVETTDLFETYLSAFPEGTNPIFRERTEHDCSCCKAFIRNIGNVVAIQDGRVVTVWDDFESAPAPYDVVGRILAERVRQSPIRGVWRTKERRYGVPTSAELLDGGETRTWHHFSGVVGEKNFSLQPERDRGSINTTAHVLERGLKEISREALDTVIDLIEANNLLRGEEFLSAIRGFRTLKAGYEAAEDRNLFVWSNLEDRSSRFRNTAIGQLLLELSEGTDLEVAVRKYEAMVGGANYKRPTALVTPRMVEAGIAKLDELGLRPTIERRHARVEDVSVRDVLFVDNGVAGKMKDALADMLMGSTTAPPTKIENPTPISAEDFFQTVVPRSQQISALVENRHAGNFVSITTGEPGLFAWDNGFSWSYDGDVADSIKSRVKAAGGNVEAKFRVSLAWFNTDDLDIHCQPPSGPLIYYGNRSGILDVDMNVGHSGRLVTDPVENLAWTRVQDGLYRIDVNQYCRRNSHDVGFALEVEINGRVQQYRYARSVSGTVKALEIEIRGGEIVAITVGEGLEGGAFQGERWGVKTETLVPIDALMLSPNHWSGQQIGNKHWFFILRGAKNPDPVRGIYNEYLRPDLNEHRKVFEVLGSKTKAPPAEEQLSGLGFSSTQRNTLKVVAKGADFNRAYEVQF